MLFGYFIGFETGFPNLEILSCKIRKLVEVPTVKQNHSKIQTFFHVFSFFSKILGFGIALQNEEVVM